MLWRSRSIAQCTTITLTYAIEAAGSRQPGGVMVSALFYVLLVCCCWSVEGCWLRVRECTLLVHKVRTTILIDTGAFVSFVGTRDF